MAEEKEIVAEEAKSSNMPMILVAVLTLVIGCGRTFCIRFYER